VTHAQTSTHGLRAAAAWLLALLAGAWLVGALTAGRALAAETVTVEIQGFAFSPAAITIQVGDTVTWTNLDGTDHTATSDAGAPEAFDTGALASNASASITFTTPGTYAYTCRFHTVMSGTVIVEAPPASSEEAAPSSAGAAPSSAGAAASQLPDGATGRSAAVGHGAVTAVGALLLLAGLSALAVAGARRAIEG